MRRCGSADHRVAVPDSGSQHARECMHGEKSKKLQPRFHLVRLKAVPPNLNEIPYTLSTTPTDDSRCNRNATAPRPPGISKSTRIPKRHYRKTNEGGLNSHLNRKRKGHNSPHRCLLKTYHFHGSFPTKNGDVTTHSDTISFP